MCAFMLSRNEFASDRTKILQGSEETSVRTLGHVVLFARVAAGFFESAFEGADIKPVRYAGSATRAQLTSLYTRYANAAMKSSMSSLGAEDEAAAADSADMAQLDLLQFIFEIDEKQVRAHCSSLSIGACVEAL